MNENLYHQDKCDNHALKSRMNNTALSSVHIFTLFHITHTRKHTHAQSVV